MLLFKINCINLNSHCLSDENTLVCNGLFQDLKE